MLPPKKWLVTGTSRMSSLPREATNGASTRAPYSPVRMAIGAASVAVPAALSVPDPWVREVRGAR